MVAYQLKNTVTENGSVARGICQVEIGLLTDVVETLGIVKQGEDAAFPDENGKLVPLSGLSQVSMNCWGFGRDMLRQLVRRFPAWLDENLPVNPLKAEYFLPFVANSMIQDGSGCVHILECTESWHGITYREDKPTVEAALADLRAKGLYPEKLWE